MKLILTAALLAALATPLAASAQTYPAEGAAPATTQGQPVPRLYKRWSTLLNGLNLSSQQHDQIQNILDQFAQAHPPGSPKDPNAVKTMRQQIFAVLNPQQQEQLRQNMRQMRIQS